MLCGNYLGYVKNVTGEGHFDSVRFRSPDSFEVLGDSAMGAKAVTIFQSRLKHQIDLLNSKESICTLCRVEFEPPSASKMNYIFEYRVRGRFVRCLPFAKVKVVINSISPFFVRILNDFTGFLLDKHLLLDFDFLSLENLVYDGPRNLFCFVNFMKSKYAFPVRDAHCKSKSFYDCFCSFVSDLHSHLDARFQNNVDDLKSSEKQKLQKNLNKLRKFDSKLKKSTFEQMCKMCKMGNMRDKIKHMLTNNLLNLCIKELPNLYSENIQTDSINVNKKPQHTPNSNHITPNQDFQYSIDNRQPNSDQVDLQRTLPR